MEKKRPNPLEEQLYTIGGNELRTLSDWATNGLGEITLLLEYVPSALVKLKLELDKHVQKLEDKSKNPVKEVNVHRERKKPVDSQPYMIAVAFYLSEKGKSTKRELSNNLPTYCKEIGVEMDGDCFRGRNIGDLLYRMKNRLHYVTLKGRKYKVTKEGKAFLEKNPIANVAGNISKKSPNEPPRERKKPVDRKPYVEVIATYLSEHKGKNTKVKDLKNAVPTYCQEKGLEVESDYFRDHRIFDLLSHMKTTLGYLTQDKKRNYMLTKLGKEFAVKCISKEEIKIKSSGQHRKREPVNREPISDSFFLI